MYKEFLLTLLQSVIIASVPIITTFVCTFISTKNKEAKQRMNSEEAKKLMDEAETAVITAVMFTNQTYVDTLKKSGQFTVENQKEAFTKAFEKAVEIMSKEAIDFINDVYGSLNAWLPTQIEAKVNESKSKLGSPSN